MQLRVQYRMHEQLYAAANAIVYQDDGMPWTYVNDCISLSPWNRRTLDTTTAHGDFHRKRERIIQNHYMRLLIRRLKFPDTIHHNQEYLLRPLLVMIISVYIQLFKYETLNRSKGSISKSNS